MRVLYWLTCVGWWLLSERTLYTVHKVSMAGIKYPKHDQTPDTGERSFSGLWLQPLASKHEGVFFIRAQSFVTALSHLVHHASSVIHSLLWMLCHSCSSLHALLCMPCHLCFVRSPMVFPMCSILHALSRAFYHVRFVKCAIEHAWQSMLGRARARSAAWALSHHTCSVMQTLLRMLLCACSVAQALLGMFCHTCSVASSLLHAL